MTMILKQIFDLIKLLHSEVGTRAIAWGVVMGFVMGMSPTLSLQTLMVFVLLFLFRIQIGAALLTMAFVKVFAHLFDPIFHHIGSLALEANGLKSLWAQLYNMPLVPFTKFYNSVVMGSGITAILLAPIVYILAYVLTSKYRTVVVTWVANTKYWKWFKATSIYKWYATYSNLYGGSYE